MTSTKRNRIQKRRRTTRRTTLGGVPMQSNTPQYIKVKFFHKPKNSRTKLFIISEIECASPFAGKEIGKILSNSFDLGGIMLKGKITLKNNKYAVSKMSTDSDNINDTIEFRLLPEGTIGYYVQILKITPGFERKSIFSKLLKSGKMITSKDKFNPNALTENVIVHGQYMTEINDAFNGFRRNVYNVNGCKTAVSGGGGGGTWNALGSNIKNTSNQYGAGIRDSAVQANIGFNDDMKTTGYKIQNLFTDK